MTKHVGTAIGLAAFFFLLPRPACSQQIATSFDELTKNVRPGETLVVTDTRGATVEGTLVSLAGTSLDMTLGRNRSTPPLRIPASDVNNIVVTRPDALWNGPLIGLAIGAGTGLLIELATRNEYQKFQGGAVIGVSVLSMATGLVIDLFNRPKVVVYVRPQTIP